MIQKLGDDNFLSFEVGLNFLIKFFCFCVSKILLKQFNFFYFFLTFNKYFYFFPS